MDWIVCVFFYVEFDDNVLMDQQVEQILYKMVIMNYVIDVKKCYWVFKKKIESLKIIDFLLLYFYMYLLNVINDFIF